MNILIFRIFTLFSREAIFLAVFLKNMADPLGVKLDGLHEKKYCKFSIQNIQSSTKYLGSGDLLSLSKEK